MFLCIRFLFLSEYYIAFVTKLIEQLHILYLMCIKQKFAVILCIWHKKNYWHKKVLSMCRSEPTLESFSAIQLFSSSLKYDCSIHIFYVNWVNLVDFSLDLTDITSLILPALVHWPFPWYFNNLVFILNIVSVVNFFKTRFLKMFKTR